MDTELENLRREVEKLRAQLKRKRYGLVWLDVPEAIEGELETQIPVLQEVPENAILGQGESNLLIEGDNYHALSCLNFTHRKSVDVIYIDPPYNTGSDNFRYKDRRVLDKFPDGELVPKDHPLRHSFWLSFMSKRLRLAKNLLKPEGVIFISINEDELAQLKLLCDEIFGPSNYLAMFTIKVRHEERILKGDKDFHEVVEYLLMYRSSPAYKTVKKLRDNTSDDEYVWEVVEKSAPIESRSMGKKSVDIFAPGSFEITKKPSSGSLLKKTQIRGTLREGNSSGRFYVEHIEPLDQMKGYLFKVPGIGDDGLGFRYFLSPTKNKNGDYFQGVPQGRADTKEIPHPNYLDWVEEFNNVGKQGGVDFGGGKKPIEFLGHYLSIGSQNKNAVVLDFFAGSGSTGHAVLDMNSRDGGERKFILVSLAEETVKDKNTRIMEDVCLQRMKNIHGEYGAPVRYYRAAYSGSTGAADVSDEDRLELASNANNLLAIAERTYEPVSRSSKFALYKSEVREKHTAIYFSEDLSEFELFVEATNALDGEVTVYLFSWGSIVEFADEFDNPLVKVKPIPEPIIEVYRQLNLGGGAGDN
jgi:adenine-specific DNA-methyltransferase